MDDGADITQDGAETRVYYMVHPSLDVDSSSFSWFL